MTETDKLWPCPHCGKTETLEFATRRENEDCPNFDDCDAEKCEYGACDYFGNWDCVVCSVIKSGCGATGGYASCPAEAVEKWNTRATLGSEINGETSDGYHTFNELYHHRAVLFSVIVRDHSERAWKARRHHDGTMYDGMFIVGIETPDGQATYHYDLDPYWDMFDCEEREFAPEWDGHTPDEAIARIATLGGGTCEFTIEYDRDEVERRRKMYEENPLDLFPQDMPESAWTCSNCGQQFKCHYDRQTGKLLPVPDWMKCCPSCGKRIKKAVE